MSNQPTQNLTKKTTQYSIIKTQIPNHIIIKIKTQIIHHTMGSVIAKLWKSIASGPKPLRILMVGLDNAGKTTILYKLKIGEVVTTIPTIGFNVENVEYKNLKFTVWDVGGQQTIRQLWKHYYSNTDGIIFVIDSHDNRRLLGNEYCG